MELRFTFTYTVHPEAGQTEADVLAAGNELALVMDVQSEDGLYSLGYKDAGAWPAEGDEENVYVARFSDGEIGVELV